MCGYCVLAVPPLNLPAGYSCGDGNFGCIERLTGVYRCYRNKYKCDGIDHCDDGTDEHGCSKFS